MADRALPLVIVDLEATCWNDHSVPRSEMEIIEIGAVRVNPASLQVVDEFQSFVRPGLHQLSPFCRELTGIAQNQVDGAPAFPEALDAFFLWSTAGGPILLGSWGDYDRKQLIQDCTLHGLQMPFEKHMNLKREFQQKLLIRKGLGLGQALRRVGLEFEGRQHRGIDDARNIARLLPWILGSN